MIGVNALLAPPQRTIIHKGNIFPMISQERLKELLHYNPETGVFRWLPRPVNTREERRWNTRYANKTAGHKRKKTGYVTIYVHGRLYMAHQLAFLYMTGDFPKNQIDHKDGNTNNNKWNNLREATHAQNMQNRKLLKSSTSGVSGVIWDKEKRRWRARISVNGKRIILGRFRDKSEAIKARRDAELKYFGEFTPTHSSPSAST